MPRRVTRYDEWYDAPIERVAEPYFEPDSFEWIVEPTSKCSSPRCHYWFRTDRRVCPMCRHPRRKR